MKKILFILLLGSVNLIYSQNQYIHQVLILNEGYLDFYTDEIIEPVTVGIYSIADSEPVYADIIEITDAKFSSDLIINEGYFYVAADDRILKYHLDTYELIAEQNVDGVRKLAIHDNYLFVSKGDYDNETFGPVVFDSYLDVFDLDLNFQFSFDTENGPQWSTENLLVEDNKLYVLINNAYEWGNYQGMIGVVDLNTLNYEAEIDLGDDAKNPINLMLKDDKLYTLNNKNWDGSSISVVDINNSDDIQTLNLSDVSAGCGVSIIRGDKLNYQKSGDLEMGIVDLETLTQTGVESNLNLNYYSVSEDPITGNLFAATADFVTNSQIYVYDSNNTQIADFTAGVTTNKIVFDIRLESVSIDEVPKDNDYVIKVLDFLGRDTKKEGLYIEIYNNGFVNKKHTITK
ncbi:MAG: hypothetical protein CMP50_00580 [Flavobacteriales bacterium]|nr:hypothetical protein [Flavobacteriales bacterium]|tara:strand:+ start:720 stop:1925 length:1206 start_codon:yes stop_codon:yes gene_type:complete